MIESTLMQTNSPLSPGTTLGRYEIRSQIGAGGMGEVFLARDTQLDRTVALKILLEPIVADQTRLQRFMQEAKSASAFCPWAPATRHSKRLGLGDVSGAARTRTP